MYYIPLTTPLHYNRTPPTKDQEPACPTEVLFIALDDLPGVAPQLYTPQPGQVFMAEDISQGEVWKVKALSGDVAGEIVWVQRNCLEEYSAPINLRPLKKTYRVLNTLSGYVDCVCWTGTDQSEWLDLCPDWSVGQMPDIN